MQYDRNVPCGTYQQHTDLRHCHASGGYLHVVLVPHQPTMA